MTGDGGIVLYNNGQATLDHSSVSDNNNYGIYFWVQSAGMTAHLSVSNSTVSNNSYAGISSSNAGSIIANISGSIFSNNGSSNGYGIYITGNNTSTITDSSFISNRNSGISVSPSNNITLTNNIFTNNGSYAATLSFNNGSFSFPFRQLRIWQRAERHRFEWNHRPECCSTQQSISSLYPVLWGLDHQQRHHLHRFTWCGLQIYASCLFRHKLFLIKPDDQWHIACSGNFERPNLLHFHTR